MTEVEHHDGPIASVKHLARSGKFWIIVDAIASVVGAVAAVIALYPHNQSSLGSPDWVLGSTVKNSPSTTVSGLAEIRFLTPKWGDTVTPGQDLLLSGTVSGLPAGDSVWLLETSPSEGIYLFLDGSKSGPFATADGEFARTDPGGPKEGGTVIFYVAFQAGSACNEILSNSARDWGGTESISRTSLSAAGCIRRQQLEVNISR
jgi:hypothetical protein